MAELTAEEREKLVGMEQRLHERVIGQEEAVRAVSDAVRRSRAGSTEGGRPIATLLFLGPQGSERPSWPTLWRGRCLAIRTP